MHNNTKTSIVIHVLLFGHMVEFGSKLHVFYSSGYVQICHFYCSAPLRPQITLRFSICDTNYVSLTSSTRKNGHMGHDISTYHLKIRAKPGKKYQKEI